MDIYCLVTPHGLVPLYDDDYDQKKRLRNGSRVRCHITRVRNTEHHKKFFALINLAWEYQPERVRRFFHESIDGFRATLTIAAGHYDTVFCMATNSWIQVPKSISYANMDQTEFEKLYNDVLAVICTDFLTEVSEEEFNNILRNF